MAIALTAGLATYARGDCGNGVIDSGEECDSGRVVCAGGLNPLQSCSTAAECFGGTCTTCDTGITCTGVGNRDDLADECRSDCKLPSCGDGVTDTPENCDDANANNSDACHNDCTFNTCGDGVRDTSSGSTEDCDDGNVTSGDGCSSLCIVESCGTGLPSDTKPCDQGQGTCVGGLNAGADCSRNSQCLSGTCSDGPDNRDDLADHCRSTCTLPRCGDGTTDTPENCDDGNAVNTDACRNDCKFNVCGDGFRNPATEPCDDGNNVSGDGCSATCQNETCGDGTKQPSEKCDLGAATCQAPALNAGDGCKTAAECFGGPCSDGPDNRNDVADRCRADCSLPRCGDGATDTPENCDDGNAVNTDACHNNCTNNVCGDGVRNPATEPCDDGNLVSGDGCSATCIPEGCNDGAVGPSEQCDNGNATCTSGVNTGGTCKTTAECLGGACSDAPDNRDDLANHCRSNCTLPRCGDGVTDVLEFCDDGNAVNGDACRNDCKANICGDGFRNPATEQCDDGNLTPGDGCNAGCNLESCGDGTKQPSEQCDAGQATCTSGVATGANCNTTLQCLGGACSDVAPSDNRDDLADHCRSSCRFPSCGDAVTDGPEFCDDGNASNGDVCRNDCKANICGDGFRNPAAEQCDDGNLTSGDGCDAGCNTEKCGDGIKQTALGEECDAGQATCIGGLTPGDACATNAQCILGTCSTGGNRNDLANYCRSNCKLPSCGDSQTDPPEVCDDGNTDNDDACTNDCKAGICGDGFVQPTEPCDDGNTISGDGCSATCQIEKCGDTVTQIPTEECDPPGATCTNACCYIGSSVGPAPITSVTVGFDTLGACHMAKLCKAAASCGTRVARLCEHAWQRVEQARVFFSTNRNSRAIRRLHSAERLLERLARMVGRSSITCPNEPGINDEAARAGDLTNLLKNTIQF